MSMSEEEVMRRIVNLPDNTRKAIVCALVGHSRIVTIYFGHVYCGRCGNQIGDQLGGAFNKGIVIVGHNCEICRKNAAILTWEDTLLSPDPFSKEARND